MFECLLQETDVVFHCSLRIFVLHEINELRQWYHYCEQNYTRIVSTRIVSKQTRTCFFNEYHLIKALNYL